MGRNLYHSAEGSHWTKKNHKYIRKEGNRYIYPSDLKKISRDHADQMKESRELRNMERHEHLNRQGSKNYKQLSEQHANRQAAKNGMVVNPVREARWSDSEKVIARIPTKGKRPSNTASDYKEYSKQYSDRNPNNPRNRYKTIPRNGNYDAYTDYHRKEAANGKTVKGFKQKMDGSFTYVESENAKDRQQQSKSLDQRISWKRHSKERLQEKNRKNAMNSQGSFQKGSQEYAKVNAPVGKKRAQRLADEKKVREKQKNALNNQGLHSNAQEYAKHQGKQAEDKREYNKAKRKLEGWQTEQEFLVNNASNKLKKQGYFTIKNGKTVFVPSDEVTMKKVSKGRRIVDKIKSKFSKKK